ncbi:MAG: hypothetical protein SO205_01645, partial [Bulleidia sp.]|nr:hypothetical protein [Bulleidia sp.]
MHFLCRSDTVFKLGYLIRYGYENNGLYIQTFPSDRQKQMIRRKAGDRQIILFKPGNSLTGS